MIDKMLNAFIENPKRLVALGELLITLGCWLGLAGLLGKVATTAVGAISSMASRNGNVAALAEIYPALPTAWVPESAIGFVLTLLILALGLCLRHIGRQFAHHLRY